MRKTHLPRSPIPPGFLLRGSDMRRLDYDGRQLQKIGWWRPCSSIADQEALSLSSIRSAPSFSHLGIVSQLTPLARHIEICGLEAPSSTSRLAAHIVRPARCNAYASRHEVGSGGCRARASVCTDGGGRTDSNTQGCA